MFEHLWGLMTQPAQEWQRIHDKPATISKTYRNHVLWLAAIPPLAGLIGTTMIGWSIGASDPIKLTVGSALPISILYYIGMLAAVLVVGKAVHWMAITYGATPTLDRAVELAAYTATPLLLVGILQLYPLLWLNFIVGLPALAYAVYLLYTGVPILMEIPAERGFLFSSAVVTFGLVAFVAMLAATVILWGFGIGPAFTR